MNNYKIYDLKDRRKLMFEGSAYQCANWLRCDVSYIYKAASQDLTIDKRYKVKKSK